MMQKWNRLIAFDPSVATSTEADRANSGLLGEVHVNRAVKRLSMLNYQFSRLLTCSCCFPCRFVRVSGASRVFGGGEGTIGVGGGISDNADGGIFDGWLNR